MSASINTHFERLLQKATEHKDKAHWELAENCLRDAEELCSHNDFPNAAHSRLRIQLQLAEVLRRHGKYREAIEVQEKAIASKAIDDTQRCKIYGELGVNYRHSDMIVEAADTFQKQYDIATKLAFESDAEACRAVGNLAIAKYQLYLRATWQGDDLLQQSILLQQERVATATELMRRLQVSFEHQDKDRMEEIGTSGAWRRSWATRLYMWIAIGLSRMVLSYIATKQYDLAISKGLEAVEMTDLAIADHTVHAMSRFMYGHALLANGEKDKARWQFDWPRSSKSQIEGCCTPAIALCKEPSAEHRGYLKEVIDAGVDLLAFDEQGYSALDYAVYSEDTESVNMLRTGLLSQIDFDAVDEALKMARVRKHFREIFHGQFRPILSNESSNCVKTLQSKYFELLRGDDNKRQRFDWLRAISYQDFVEKQALPRWDLAGERSVQEFERVRESSYIEPFLVFFSYRWIGNNRQPDTIENHQYRRMLDALERLLEKNPYVRKDSMYIWLDCACIDQENKEAGRKERGILALPMIVAQCDAMVSLVDEQYYQRAWCTVETMIMQTLKESSQYHQWWEHILYEEGVGKPYGLLSQGPANHERQFRPSAMDVSVETDRQYIRFLERQSMLLGKAASGS